MRPTTTITKPGWPEVFIGLLCIFVLGIGGGLMLVRQGIEPVLLCLLLATLSGVAGMVGFLAAFLLRLHSWAAFGVRRTV